MLPEFNNLYGSLFTRRSKAWVASRFKKAGWAVRMCTWTDYEVASEYAELVIEGEGEMLVQGAMIDFGDNIASVLTVLEENSVLYSIEHYDNVGGLLQTLTSHLDPDGSESGRENRH